jgi:hypothetical protein
MIRRLAIGFRCNDRSLLVEAAYLFQLAFSSQRINKMHAAASRKKENMSNPCFSNKIEDVIGKLHYPFQWIATLMKTEMREYYQRIGFALNSMALGIISL